MQASPSSVRIDKWLWAARFFKTRSLAQAAIEKGRVTLAGATMKPAREVRVGEVLAIRTPDFEIECLVRGLSQVRSCAPVARLLYEETARSLERQAKRHEDRRSGVEPAQTLQARPTKRDRRLLTTLRDNLDIRRD